MWFKKKKNQWKVIPAYRNAQHPQADLYLLHIGLCASQWALDLNTLSLSSREELAAHIDSTEA